MLCIAAFIVFALIGIFSAKYRGFAKEAWSCTAKRITFRPCDSSFGDKVKNKMLAKVLLKQPKLVKPADIAINVAAFLIVILTIWSLLVIVKSGLNLFVYGTCDYHNSQSCALNTTKACSIDTPDPTFIESVETLTVHKWVYNWFKDIVVAVEAIPNRVKYWDATDYLPAHATYTYYKSTNKTALEIIDPGCEVCQRLYVAEKQVGFNKHYNVTYIPYAIKIPGQNKYKFNNSYLIVSYLEAIRQNPLKSSKGPVDWKIIDRLFTQRNRDNILWQSEFKNMLTADEAKNQLNAWLKEFGYNDQQIQNIVQATKSQSVQNTITANRNIVENKIKTINIPTIIFNGKMYAGVPPASEL